MGNLLRLLFSLNVMPLGSIAIFVYHISAVLSFPLLSCIRQDTDTATAERMLSYANMASHLFF